jgi:dTDP-glucose 4,6-dehydratase
MKRELQWEPAVDVETGLRITVEWYLENTDWWQAILDRGFKQDRLGKAEPAK